MKKNGFTLVELLATIVIIGIVLTVAVPNIIGLSNKVRNGYLIDDAKKFIALVKYEVNKEQIRENATFNLSSVNYNGDIGKDPDGGEYDAMNSMVFYTYSDNTYCVRLLGSERSLGVNTCVEESELLPDVVEAFSSKDFQPR